MPGLSAIADRSRCQYKAKDIRRWQAAMAKWLLRYDSSPGVFPTSPHVAGDGFLPGTSEGEMKREKMHMRCRGRCLPYSEHLIGGCTESRSFPVQSRAYLSKGEKVGAPRFRPGARRRCEPPRRLPLLAVRHVRCSRRKCRLRCLTWHLSSLNGLHPLQMSA